MILFRGRIYRRKGALHVKDMYHIFVSAFIPDRLSMIYRTIQLREKSKDYCSNHQVVERGSLRARCEFC